MTTVVLSGASPRLPKLQALSIVLEDELRRRAGRTDIRTFELATMRLAYCQGEFDCWTRTPGLCRAHDAEDDIVRAIHDASELVLLDAVTFGGHSYTLKRAQDRLICLLSPFFEKRASLTHHAARYERAASLFALGWAPDSDAEVAQTWRELADANAVNMLAPRVGAVLVGDADRAQWAVAIRSLLVSSDVPGAGIPARAPLREALLHAAAGVPGAASATSPRSAALVVGSAKTRADATTPAWFAAVINCGFPEPEHNRTALRIARHFAASARYDWAGGLPLGGGGALDPSVPLDAQHGPAEHVKSALDLAAPCLASGNPIPTAAIERMAASPMPDVLYRLVGDMGWRYQAHKNGLAQAALRARPLG